MCRGLSDIESHLRCAFNLFFLSMVCPPLSPCFWCNPPLKVRALDARLWRAFYLTEHYTRKFGRCQIINHINHGFHGFSLILAAKRHKRDFTTKDLKGTKEKELSADFADFRRLFAARRHKRHEAATGGLAISGFTG